ncbi:3-deoxy-D-manno-octulosonic-acid transferase [Bordetella ansorpii]|uniref:3-deoxy-D-manno-octulosonic acid transferase n=1 Tax=Bordetella ansorpii TaxID=288768 RepID=A0A157R3D9_9BORD|nr:3-deoxy-D-manno-octulosonic acid transferase [Bordetella ansorpii]SAI51749.1 3-deoxy-D-manno-octulosonic-acid transferase [Bordetella ansorpii]
MSRGVYTLLLRLLAPLLWLLMWRRARRAGGQWGILSAGRFGGADAVAAPVGASFDTPVWVHAVSLGETRAAQPLVQALLQRGLPVLLTHTTATGRAEGARLFAGALAVGQLRQAWLPYDLPGSVARFLDRYAPRCGLLIEREVWPNLLAAARARKVPVALVSARFSASSLRQARWLGSALRQALGGLDRVLAQTEDDAHRLRQAGALAATVTGNLKFDLTLPAAQVAAGQAWRQALNRPVIALASTREGEDALFIQALLAHRDAAGQAPLYLLIPRHPQRFDEAYVQLRAAGLATVRRSAGDLPPDARTAVLLGDSLGEMAFYYAAADVAVVAGSFAPLGGQNLIEACAAGTPVIVGPHTRNFAQAVEDALAAGAALRARDAGEAVDMALALLADTPRRQAMRGAAQAWTRAHAGATQRTMQALEGWFGPR